ncbi:MAG: NAD-dependent epimerase/dehydratase family protein [Candidatus Omnitrophica bacterium]|nr:NAD-dependent epimerase/dehydratase family protein [Candidatus Omnitrophota bacterium]
MKGGKLRIGITGASAFVGEHLVKELVKAHQVIGFSRHKGELLKKIKSPNFRFKQGDITDFVCLKDALGDVDLIYHLAAVSSERLCKQDILGSFKINVEGTVNVLELGRQREAKIIYASSGAVYPVSSLPKEEKEADFVDKFYSVSKSTAEKYCRLYNKNFSLPFAILRFSRIYGEGMTRNPIYDILKAIEKGNKVKFYESLNSCYDFVYVKDVVNALLLAQNKEWENQIVNISSGRGIVLQNLIQKIEQIIGKKIGVEVVQDVQSVDILDNTKAKNLGWLPKYLLEEGLQEILGK